MNRLNKIALILILSLSVVASSFAATTPLNTAAPEADNAYLRSFDPIEYMSPRMAGMGGAGIAGLYNADSIYVNPASLGQKGVVLTTPALTFSFYNFKALAETGILDEVDLDKLKTAGISYLAKVASGKGYNTIADIDLNVGAKIKGFGVAVDYKASLLTFNSTGGTTNLEAIPKIDLTASLGYGHRFFRDNWFSLDLGAVARVSMREVFQSISYDDVVDIITASDPLDALQTKIDGNPAAIGVALPIDVGANLNLPMGLTVSGVIRNINGERTWYYADNSKDISFSDYETSNEMKVSSDPTFNVGVGWKPKMGALGRLIRPSLVFDYVDITSVSSSQDFEEESWLTHTRFGAEVELLKFLKFRAGLNQGYITVGAGFDIMNCVHVDAAYYWQEMGTSLGVKPVDACTIRFSILHE